MKIYVGVVHEGDVFTGLDEALYAFESRQGAIDYGVDLLKKSASFKSCGDKDETIRSFVNDLEEDGYAPIDLSTDYYIHEVELRKGEQ